MVRCADPWVTCNQPAIVQFSTTPAPGFGYKVELCPTHLKEHCGDFANTAFTVVQL